MKTFKLLFLSLIFSASGLLNAQSNPTPFNLGASGNYAFTSWASSSPTGTYPANMFFHLLNTTNPPVTAVAQSNLLTGFTYSNTSGTRVQGLGNNGVQFQNATTPANTGYTANKLGETVLALNTSQRTNIQVSWKAQTKTTAGNVMAMRCQYRIGNSGAYQDFPVISEYMSSSVLNDSAVMNLTLPSDLDDQALVQLRWIYYRVSGASSSSRTIRLDDISVTSVPLVSITPHSDVCINASPFALSDGSPSGGTYSGTGVVGGNMFDPAVSGAGTFLITYTYTDANNISNSASTNITVSAGACVIPVGLAAQSCGATNLARNGYIYTETAPGAQDYEYEFTGGNLSVPVTRQRGNFFTDFNLSWLPQLAYGQTYDVRVRAKVSGVWGTFANVCTVNITALQPTPQLTANSCGSTGLALNSYIYTTSVAGAQDYEYRFVNTVTGSVHTRLRGNFNTDLNLSWVTGVQYGQSYDVSVRARVNNVWGAFGSVCTISLQSFPTTQLTPASCGATGLTSSGSINTNPVGAATNYRYRFTNTVTGAQVVRARGSSSTNLPLAYVSGIAANTTYDVEVAAYAGGQWGPYGSVCQISTASDYNSMAPADSYTQRVGEETPVTADYTMYPNPAADNVVYFRINNTSEQEQNGFIEIYDMSGRLVQTESVILAPGETVTEISLANLESGAYLVRINAGTEWMNSQTLIKQ